MPPLDHLEMVKKVNLELELKLVQKETSLRKHDSFEEVDRSDDEDYDGEKQNITEDEGDVEDDMVVGSAESERRRQQHQKDQDMGQSVKAGITTSSNEHETGVEVSDEGNIEMTGADNNTRKTNSKSVSPTSSKKKSGMDEKGKTTPATARHEKEKPKPEIMKRKKSVYMCAYYRRNGCKHQQEHKKCNYLHIDGDIKKICSDFRAGLSCKHEIEGECKFRHSVLSKKEDICKYQLSSVGCKQNGECGYYHLTEKEKERLREESQEKANKNNIAEESEQNMRNEENEDVSKNEMELGVDMKLQQIIQTQLMIILERMRTEGKLVVGDGIKQC